MTSTHASSGRGASARTSPTVSVIIPTLNEGKYLPRLLVSLRRQTVPPDEILVADSGSGDATVAMAQALGARVLPGERKGPGEGRNRGARAAHGEVLVFADADGLLPYDLIESVVHALRDPEVVGGATAFRPAQGRPVERFLFRLANVYQRVLTACGLPHNAGYCFFFRRAAFVALGGIREDMLLNETHDLAFRSRDLGRFVVLPLEVETSMRRFRAHGWARTVLREYIASTVLYYATGRTPPARFHPTPAR